LGFSANLSASAYSHLFSVPAIVSCLAGLVNWLQVANICLDSEFGVWTHPLPTFPRTSCKPPVPADWARATAEKSKAKMDATFLEIQAIQLSMGIHVTLEQNERRIYAKIALSKPHLAPAPKKSDRRGAVRFSPGNLSDSSHDDCKNTQSVAYRSDV
jgi:hypothetical protein